MNAKCRINRRWLMAALSLLLMVGFSACVQTSAEVSGKKDWTQEGAPQLRYENRVDTSTMSGEIEVVSAQRQQVGDLMQVQITLRSKSPSTLNIQYRFDWFDQSGVLIKTNEAWKPLIIYTRETKMLLGTAPDSRAKEFKLELRPLD